MRTKPLVTTLFVGSLVIAAVAATHILSQDNAGGPKAQILAATMPLSQGTLLREQDVTWQGVTEIKPSEIVRPTAAALEANPALENQIRATVYGAVLRHELPAGEPILQSAIAKPGERDFLQVVLTPGERDCHPGGHWRSQHRIVEPRRSGRRYPDTELQGRQCRQCTTDAAIGQRDRGREPSCVGN